jgi:preprotein translocase subunit Sec63
MSDAGTGTKDPDFLMTLAMQADDFEVLRVALDASEKQISDSYRLLLERFSPKGDETRQQLMALEAVRHRVERAYRSLIDPHRRKELVEQHVIESHQRSERLTKRQGSESD